MEENDQMYNVIKDNSMLEDILSASNMRQAYKQVVLNKGAAGIDGMGVDELHDHLCANWSKWIWRSSSTV